MAKVAHLWYAVPAENERVLMCLVTLSPLTIMFLSFNTKQDRAANVSLNVCVCVFWTYLLQGCCARYPDEEVCVSRLSHTFSFLYFFFHSPKTLLPLLMLLSWDFLCRFSVFVQSFLSFQSTSLLTRVFDSLVGFVSLLSIFSCFISFPCLLSYNSHHLLIMFLFQFYNPHNAEAFFCPSLHKRISF